MEDPRNNEKRGILYFFIISCGKNVNVHKKKSQIVVISSVTTGLRGSSQLYESKI